MRLTVFKQPVYLMEKMCFLPKNKELKDTTRLRKMDVSASLLYARLAGLQKQQGCELLVGCGEDALRECH